MREATRLYGAMEASADAAQSGTREVNRKAIGFAETNVNATFDFAQQLVRAKDPKEIVRLHQEFLKRQVEQMSSQIKELGEHAIQTAQPPALLLGRRFSGISMRLQAGATRSP